MVFDFIFAGLEGIVFSCWEGRGRKGGRGEIVFCGRAVRFIRDVFRRSVG